MKKKNQVTQDTPQRDELVELLANELNKANKDGGKIAYFLDEQENPAEISDWISTGSSILDLAISNRPHGGLPVGKMVEFNGLEGTGKSLVSAHVVADTQRKGGVAVVIDTENAAAPEFWKSLGVDLSKLLYVQCETVEDIFVFFSNSEVIAYSDLAVMMVGSFWLFLAAFTREKTAFHDILFDTRVIYDKK
jgi:recombination protein RecA